MLEIKVTGNVGTCRLVTAAGKSPVLDVSLATNRRVGEREFTGWTGIKIWGERAHKLAPRIGKGTKLLITGRTKASAYKANDGTAKAELIVHANDIEFLSSKRELGDAPDHGPGEEAELALDSAT